LVGSPYSRFLPSFATDILHMGAVGFGLLLSAPAIGAVIAGLFLASMGKIHLRNYVLFTTAIIFSVFLIVFALSRSMVLSMASLSLVGASQMTFRSMLNARLQMETPSHLLGRVLSLLFMDRGLWSFGTLLIGSLATLMGTPWAIALCGSWCAITAVLFIYSGSVRSRAREKLRSEMPG
ncbi:MAG: MFS transporter, partial [Candidatus Binatia bacterium]